MCSPAADDAPAAATGTARMDAELAAAAARRPDDRFAVIVTARGTLDALSGALPPGARIEHAYRLVASLAIEATGAEILALAAHPAVGAIEPVRDVAAT